MPFLSAKSRRSLGGPFDFANVTQIQKNKSINTDTNTNTNKETKKCI